MFQFGKNLVGRYPSPLPPPLESRDWRGFRKNGLQNLQPQGFRGQNIDNKQLRLLAGHSLCTAWALIIICFSNFSRKVRCHITPVEIRTQPLLFCQEELFCFQPSQSSLLRQVLLCVRCLGGEGKVALGNFTSSPRHFHLDQ